MARMNVAKTERNSQIKRDRRKILALLRTIFPGWMRGEELYLHVLDSNPLYDRVLCVKDLTYLNLKGYIRFRGEHNLDARTVSVKQCEFSLTATGSEVAEEILADPALDI